MVVKKINNMIGATPKKLSCLLLRARHEAIIAKGFIFSASSERVIIMHFKGPFSGNYLMHFKVNFQAHPRKKYVEYHGSPCFSLFLNSSREHNLRFSKSYPANRNPLSGFSQTKSVLCFSPLFKLVL